MSTSYSKSTGGWTSVMLFLVVFGIWQAYDLLMTYFPVQPLSVPVIYLAMHGASLAIFILFVKLGKSDLRRHGFKKPSNPGKSVVLSISFVVFYVLASLAPGLLFGIRYRPPLGIVSISFNAARAILISLTNESIFRGYIFKNFSKRHGLLTALYASSIMFGLHRYDEPVSIVGILTMTQYMSIAEVIGDALFTEILPAFVGGLFLGFMFHKMEQSLLGPVLFNMGVLLYFTLSPIVVNLSWWMALTFEVMIFVCLFVLIDAAIPEPSRRTTYGLER